MRCKACDRKMRSKTDASSPDLVTLGGRGLCSTCYGRDLALARLEKSKTLPQCIHCHKNMRPYKTKAAQFPGTVPAYGKKICWTCQQRINLPDVENINTRPTVTIEEYLAVKRLVKDDLELLQVLGLDQFEEVNV